MYAVKETDCTHCSKREVCKYTNDFMDFTKQTDELMVKIPDLFKIYTECLQFNKRATRDNGVIF